MATQPAHPNFWGSSPATESAYYALHGISGQSAHYTAPSGRSLFTRSWSPLDSPPRALIFMIHGYGNDISWTMQSTAVYLASIGKYYCFASDLPGHGRSDGLRAFVPDLNSVISDLRALFKTVRGREEFKGLKAFLFGESMGGAIGLMMHLEGGKEEWDGAVLVAPMCQISEKIRPPWPVPQILTVVARFAPTLAVVPTADLVEKSVKVPEKRIIAMSNPMRYNEKPRLGTVVELLRVTQELSSRLDQVSIPFIVLHGSSDEVTDPTVSQTLYQKASSEDKTIKIYDGMLHSLLFGEPDENVAIVRKDVLSWLDERVRRCGELERDNVEIERI
ncbi:hypothetical protein LUZ60_010572 [Juncus effusus]|nr:hypothetical protein LUZ60_010572 [Juncus effusus]